MTTLAQWQAKHPRVYVEVLSTGAKQVFVPVAHELRLQRSDVVALFSLSDYLVSSAVSGPSYILVPRKDSEEPLLEHSNWKSHSGHTI